MLKWPTYLLSGFMLASLTSCGLINKTQKQTLVDGIYHSGKSQKVYVNVDEENILVYPMVKEQSYWKIDSTRQYTEYPPLLFSSLKKVNLSKSSLDVDLLTIPIKYRFSQSGVPAQLNASLNAALYLGYRTDLYQLNYPKNLLSEAERETRHFGYSLGVFSGFGNTLMSPTNSLHRVDDEYDALVWSYGVAGIVGINNFSLGLVFGFDTMLNQHRNVWIYNNKPWLGLSFGLNLN